jgi:hypothetical protein
MSAGSPQPAYLQSVDSPLVVDRELYGRLAEETDGRSLAGARAWSAVAGWRRSRLEARPLSEGAGR